MKLKAFQQRRREFEALGQQVYERLKEELEAKYKGKIAAIEVSSGDYFIGDTVVEAIKKAEEKFPDDVFYIVRVGYPAVYVRRYRGSQRVSE